MTIIILRAKVDKDTTKKEEGKGEENLLNVVAKILHKTLAN